MLPGREGHVGVTAANNRQFVDTVLCRFRAGTLSRALPPHFSDWDNTHRRFSQWAGAGVWKGVFEHLTSDADNERARIDPTIARANQDSAGARKALGKQAVGRSRGGLGTKVHAVVAALGNPAGFHFAGGQTHDLERADHLIAALRADTLIADRACDADVRVIASLDKAGKQAVIPPRRNRKAPRSYDKHLCKARHLVENFFARLKPFQAIATRDDETDNNFRGAI